MEGIWVHMTSGMTTYYDMWIEEGMGIMSPGIKCIYSYRFNIFCLQRFCYDIKGQGSNDQTSD